MSAGDGTLDLFDTAPDPPPAPAGPEDGAGTPADAASTPSSAESPTVWTVSQVNRAVRNLLEGTLQPLWVSGEVGGWTRHRSGHCYFTLKDEGAQLRCVMFRSDAARLPTDPEEGMEVRAHGQLTLYEARGDYQLVARKLEADGAEGLWRLAFEKLRKKLAAEGLLAPERKRPLPRFPECVGVVTSPTGAALRDVLTVIRRRAPWTRVLVRGCRVQGEGSAQEIAAALRVLGGSGQVQVIIVGRGGGSIEDLWAFNEEPVARAIAACPVPVISAVGHEVDVTIADLVADHRCPTPSAAGEAVVQDRRTLLDRIGTLPLRLARGLRGAVARRGERIGDAALRMERALRALLEPRRRSANEAERRLQGAVEQLLERRTSRLGALAGKVEALSPLSTLRRGYAVPLGDGGRVLRSVGEFEAGREFTLRVVDGRVACRAEAAEPDEREEGDGA